MLALFTRMKKHWIMFFQITAYIEELPRHATNFRLAGKVSSCRKLDRKSYAVK